MRKSILICLLLLAGSRLQAQTNEDEKAIRAVILDYVNSFYLADSAKVIASVHPQLAKRGFYKRDNAYREATMSFQEMKRLCMRWNKSRNIPADAPKDITVFEIQEKIASAKVRALWGTDYFHLLKDNGQWKIIQVLWQD